MPATKLLYLTDSYKKTADAKIQKVETEGKNTAVTLNQTIFYPQGGGQPCDQGLIQGDNGSLKVQNVLLKGSQVIHQGKLTGKLSQSDSVSLQLDWDRRFKHMQWHTAGHLLDEAVKALFPEHPGTKASHGLGNDWYVIFKGFIDASHLDTIQNKINELIQNDLEIVSRMVSKDEIDAENIFIPFKLPTNKPLRLIKFGDYDWVPDGGTQLKSTSESMPITVTDCHYPEGNTQINYLVESITDSPGTVKTETKSAKNQASLSQINAQADALVTELKASTESPQALNVAFLGKKGKFNQLAKMLPSLPNQDKARAGKILNQTKQALAKIIESKTSINTPQSTWFDPTIPGTKPKIGRLHPISLAINEIQHIFETIGFTRVRYPEVDWDYYVFEALNMPQNHPARDEWETFFIDAPPNPKKGQMVLTTHTSNGQVREMERLGNPPIRMLNLAKCYRRQEDATHTAMFHQFEGLVIDEGINIGHLKGTIEYFAQQFYGQATTIRLRPFHFQFTEPSFEVDFQCTICGGAGVLKNGHKCKLCKSGWLEVAGAGMVHPNVLKFGGLDPQKYTGFAFGMGVERALTLKPGLQLDDIRPFYQNNLEFLAQF